MASAAPSATTQRHAPQGPRPESRALLIAAQRCPTPLCDIALGKRSARQPAPVTRRVAARPPSGALLLSAWCKHHHHTPRQPGACPDEEPERHRHARHRSNRGRLPTTRLAPALVLAIPAICPHFASRPGFARRHRPNSEKNKEMTKAAHLASKYDPSRPKWANVGVNPTTVSEQLVRHNCCATCSVSGSRLSRPRNVENVWKGHASVPRPLGSWTRWPARRIDRALGQIPTQCDQRKFTHPYAGAHNFGKVPVHCTKPRFNMNGTDNIVVHKADSGVATQGIILHRC